jgi:hypothetical protein
MSSIALPNTPEAAGKTLRPIEPAQQTAAKVAGLAYLVTTASSIFGVYAGVSLVTKGDAVQTAWSILASERLYRIAAATDVATFALVVVLVVALYTVLEPVNRPLALLAAFSRVAECTVLAAITLNKLVALSLLDGAGYLRALPTEQLQALAYTFIRAHGAGYRLGMVFYGLGSTVFACLWLKSRYVPRVLAVLGIFSASALGIGFLAAMVVPPLASVVFAVLAPLGGVFEFGLGLWLVVKGIRAPAVAPGAAG